ncbi:MAG: ABC transporter substrate-binding protein [Pseudomonadota bacterium]|nr:ABC transporter substrate-binding protein [Pseudomonadota bacterium]
MIGKNLKWFLLILCFMIGVAKAVASPDDVVKVTADGVISHIANNRSVLEKNPGKIYEMVDQLIIPRFDFISMSKWVLGKHWKQASEVQRSEFITQFKALLVRTYARALLEYSGQEIKYFPSEQNPKSNIAVVKTELTSASNTHLPILYRMHQKNEEWKVVDVSVDGVSLVTTYRGSFATQIKKNGFDSLLNELSKKNARLEASTSK